jgi:hypothetical protein
MMDLSQPDPVTMLRASKMSYVAINVSAAMGADTVEMARDSIIACAAVMLGSVVDEKVMTREQIMARVAELIDYSIAGVHSQRAKEKEGVN